MRKNVLKCDITGVEFTPTAAAGKLVGFIKESDGSLSPTVDIEHVDVHLTAKAIESIHAYEALRIANEATP